VKWSQWLALSWILFGFFQEAHGAQSFQSEVEQDVLMTRRLPLYLLHQLGDVKISGTVQDRIRVKLRFQVQSESREEAEQAFKNLGLVTFETRERFEIRVGHARGQDLVTKMRSKSKHAVRVDLEIRAPYQSDLTLLLGEGRSLKVDHWRGGLTLSGMNSTVELQRLEMNKPLIVNCAKCPVTLRDSRVNGRLVVGSKPVLIERVESSGELAIDQGSEEVRVLKSRGLLSVHSGSGPLTVEGYSGVVNFQSDEGGAFLSQIEGASNVRTQSGQVMLDFETLKGPVHVDTERGDVQIALHPAFEGTLDLMSLRGEVMVQFPYEVRKGASQVLYGPVSPGRVDARVGSHQGHYIHAYTRQGGVRILRKAPSK
jgi:hypothetical protein